MEPVVNIDLPGQKSSRFQAQCLRKNQRSINPPLLKLISPRETKSKNGVKS